MNPEENPHVYDMDTAGYMTVKQAWQQCKASSNEKPASDCNKNTAVATGSCKLMSCSVLAVVIACISILVALGSMAIAMRSMTNMAAMQSQVTMSIDETNNTMSFLCMLAI